MRSTRCSRQRIMLIFVAAVFFAGCSSLTASLPKKTPERKDDVTVAETQAVLSALSNKNNMLRNFKGVGKIKVRQTGKIRIDERIAWIGSETTKLNIVILVSGHPAVKMASDGKWFYYYEAREDKPLYKKIPATDANLKRIISIPIKTSDVINLLAGRVPLREHHSVLLEKQTSGNGYVLVLKRRWWGVTEKIFLDENKSQVHQIQFFNRSGSLIYSVRFDDMQMIKEYQVPSRLSISNDDDVDLQIVVDRYWVDVPVTSSMFVLNPPN